MVTQQVLSIRSSHQVMFRVPRLWLPVQFKRHHIGLLRHTRQTQHACMLVIFSHFNGSSFWEGPNWTKSQKKEVFNFHVIRTLSFL